MLPTREHTDLQIDGDENAALSKMSRPIRPVQAALDGDAARISAELSRLDGCTDPFAAAVRATRMPTIITDPRQRDNPVVFANDAFFRLTGYQREEILGHNCRFLQGPETDMATVARIGAALKAAEPIEVDIRNYRKDGELFWNRLLLAPLHDAAGNLAYFFANQVDVTLEHTRLAGLETHNAALTAEVADRRRELSASEERLRQIAETVRDVFYVANPRVGRIEYISPAYERIWGLPAAGLYADQTAFVQGIHPDDQDRVLTVIASQADGEPTEQRYRVVRPDGSERRIWDRAWPIRNGDGAVYRVVGIAEDETERVLAEEYLARGEAELRRLNETLELRVAERTAALTQAVDALNTEAHEREHAEAQLRQSHKMEAVGQLTGGIAHDFNNMLQAIGGSLELMHLRVEQGRAGEAIRYVEGARKTVERAAALTHRLLAFSRQQALRPRLVDPDALIAGMEELICRTVGPAITVELRMGDGVWTVLCDPNQLENVLLNLAINARDAMPDGGRLTFATAYLRLGASDFTGHEGVRPGDYVEVTVTDTGTGMDEATQRRAFEPFFTTKPTGQGTGLGLSQVYGFVRQAEGIVRLDSTPGRGTTMRLYLPRNERTGA